MAELAGLLGLPPPAEPEPDASDIDLRDPRWTAAKLAAAARDTLRGSDPFSALRLPTCLVQSAAVGATHLPLHAGGQGRRGGGGGGSVRRGGGSMVLHASRTLAAALDDAADDTSRDGVGRRAFLAQLVASLGGVGPASRARIPAFQGVEVDLLSLFTHVAASGGHEKVASERRWTAIGERVSGVKATNVGLYHKAAYDACCVAHEAALRSRGEYVGICEAAAAALPADATAHGGGGGGGAPGGGRGGRGGVKAGAAGAGAAVVAPPRPAKPRPLCGLCGATPSVATCDQCEAPVCGGCTAPGWGPPLPASRCPPCASMDANMARRRCLVNKRKTTCVSTHSSLTSHRVVSRTCARRASRWASSSAATAARGPSTRRASWRRCRCRPPSSCGSAPSASRSHPARRASTTWRTPRPRPSSSSWSGTGTSYSTEIDARRNGCPQNKMDACEGAATGHAARPCRPRTASRFLRALALACRSPPPWRVCPRFSLRAESEAKRRRCNKKREDRCSAEAVSGWLVQLR